MPWGSVQFWLCVAGLLVFLPCYYATFRREGRAMFGPIAVIVALGTVLAPFNTGASVFMHYASFQIGQATTARNAVLVVAGICGLMLVDTWLFDLPQYYYGPGLLVAVGMVGISINERQRHLANTALRRSQEEVTHLAQLAERERIARDLHDVIGHTLSTMTLKAELASKLVATDPARSASEMRDIARTARETLGSVRETVSGYRRIGLAEQLDDARDALASAGIDLEVRVDEVEMMPREESMLALLVREAVTNVIRHAGASRCSVSLGRDAHGLQLVVEDDGVGFSGDEGQGLTGMRERLAMLDGQLSFDKGSGTRLIARVPRGESA